MAVSMQASSTVGSRVQGIPKSLSARGGSESLLRSQFLGSGRIHIPCGTRTTQVVVHNSPSLTRGIRSASFFEKLGQLFSSSELDKEQVLPVYELNKGDRGSPILLKGPFKLTTPTLGDVVPYTNKVFDASGKRYLGLSAGVCFCIENARGAKAGDRYETTYTHYLGDYGQLSAMGPYFTTSDSEMVVTGGTGIFRGAQGIVKLHSVMPPIHILYTYYLTGIKTLPPELTIPVGKL